MATERTDLETFLKDVPEDAAGQARAAAGRIDELARVAARTQGIERKYMPWFIVSGLMSIAAAVLVFSDPETLAAARRLIGVMGLTVMASALPVVAIVYTIQVRDRTRADRQAFELNKTHFLPLGGLYFPSHEGHEACVILTEQTKPTPQLRERDRRYRAGRIW